MCSTMPLGRSPLFAACKMTLVLALAAVPGKIFAQSSAPQDDLPVLVVTPTRSPLALSQSGTAITVVERKQIEAWGAKSFADVIRAQPGVDITENGGPGGLSLLSLRGSNPGQTLVLIDGLRVGDASGIGGEFDFSTLSTHDIERIEILRGPQSAIYGSDAMGGVVNIITRRGSHKPRTVLTIEGGSYGTIGASLSTAGSTEKLSYAFSLHGFHTDGFSRFAYRIPRLTSQLTAPLERDKTSKSGATARVTYRPAPGVEIDLGFRHFNSAFRFDNPGDFVFAARDTRFNKGRQNLTIAFARISNVVLDGALKNSLTVFANQTDRFNRLQQSCYDAFFWSYDCDVRFRSRRIGAEYQSDVKLGVFGTLIVGARHEREQASNTEQWLNPLLPAMPTFAGRQITNSVFALHQASLGAVSLSIGGRIDSVDGKNIFPTWRATAAYRIAETGTKLRASAGTGAKAPTLYQRFSIYGTRSLNAEQNFGYEAGIDQDLWNGRIRFSATAFDTHYRNLIDFDFTGNGGIGAYFNVGRARMRGVEWSVDTILVPEIWRLRAAYTYLRARDETRGLPLLRRPRHKGLMSIVYTGLAKTEIEGRITLVGSRIDVQNDFPYSRVRMAPYARLDARVAYKATDNITVFTRFENITNARYQEIRDYGTAGRSIFAGAKVTW